MIEAGFQIFAPRGSKFGPSKLQNLQNSQLLKQSRVIPYLLRPLKIEPVLLHGDLWVSTSPSIYISLLI